MSIFDFNRDGEVSSSEQAFGLGAILAALSETEAEVKITIKASTGGDEDYESMDRDELESLLEELQEQREDLEDEEPDDPCSDAYDQALIALEVEEAVYDPEDQLLLLYAASGTNYEVSRIVRANADSMIKELAEKGFCDMTQFTATEVED